MSIDQSPSEKTITTDNLILKCTEGKPILLKMKTNKEYREFLRSLRLEQEKSQSAIAIAQPFVVQDRLKEDEITLNDVINAQPTKDSDKSSSQYKKWKVPLKWDGQLTPPVPRDRWSYGAESEHDAQYKELEASPVSMLLVDIDKEDGYKYFKRTIIGLPKNSEDHPFPVPDSVSVVGVVVEENLTPKIVENMEALTQQYGAEVLIPETPQTPAVSIESAKVKNKGNRAGREDGGSYDPSDEFRVFETEIKKQFNDEVGDAGLLFFIRRRSLFQKEMPKQWYLAIKVAHDGIDDIKDLIRERAKKRRNKKDHHDEKEDIAKACESIAVRATSAIDFTYAGGEADKELMKQTIKGFAEFIYDPVQRIALADATAQRIQETMKEVLDNVASRSANAFGSASSSTSFTSGKEFMEDLFANTLARRIVKETKEYLSEGKEVIWGEAVEHYEMIDRMLKHLRHAPKNMIESVGREIAYEARPHREGGKVDTLYSILYPRQEPRNLSRTERELEVRQVFTKGVSHIEKDYRDTGSQRALDQQKEQQKEWEERKRQKMEKSKAPK